MDGTRTDADFTANPVGFKEVALGGGEVRWAPYRVSLKGLYVVARMLQAS